MRPLPGYDWNLTVGSRPVPGCYTFVMVGTMLLYTRYKNILFLGRITL